MKVERRKLSATLVLETVVGQWNIAATEMIPLSYANLQSLRLRGMLIYPRKR